MINQISPGLLQGAAASAGTMSESRLREVSREFETVMLEIVFRQVRSATRSINHEKIGIDRDIYEGWQDQMWARAMASGGGMGLGESLYRQLQQQQLQQAAAEPE